MARGFGTTFGVGTTDVIDSRFLSPLTTTRSYGVWLWINGVGGGGLGRIFDKGPAKEFTYYDGTILAFSVSWSGGLTQWHITSPAIGSWFHFLVTYNGTNTANVPVMYTKGVSQTLTLDTAGPTGSLTTTGGTSLAIGNRTSDQLRNYDGKLAFLTIWDKAILSQAEATALARGMHPSKIRRQSIVLCDPMDGYGHSVLDLASGGNRFGSVVAGTKFQTGPPLLSPIPLPQDPIVFTRTSDVLSAQIWM